MKRLLSLAIYGLSTLVGLMAFAYPFFLPQLERAGGEVVGRNDGPLLTTLLLLICLAVLLVEIQGQVVSAKIVAALGMMVALTAVLRFIETAIPGPGGFSPIFVPIILGGYVFGARFGFLLGALSLLTSGLITGGIGPWLPFQMFTAGWMGLTAAWLPHPQRPRLMLLTLVLAGFSWGLLYGLILNLYFWPFVAGEQALSWEPGLGWQAGLSRYAAFYVASSLLWDLVSAIANALLLSVLGLPLVGAMIRFRDRFQFVTLPVRNFDAH